MLRDPPAPSTTLQDPPGPSRTLRPPSADPLGKKLKFGKQKAETRWKRLQNWKAKITINRRRRSHETLINSECDRSRRHFTLIPLPDRGGQGERMAPSFFFLVRIALDWSGLVRFGLDR